MFLYLLGIKYYEIYLKKLNICNLCNIKLSNAKQNLDYQTFIKK